MGQTGRRSLATHILAVKIDSAVALFHSFGVARQGPWITWVNKGHDDRAWIPVSPESPSDTNLVPYCGVAHPCDCSDTPYEGAFESRQAIPSSSAATASMTSMTGSRRNWKTAKVV